MIDLQITIIPPQVARDYQGLAKDVRSFHEPLKRSIQRVMAPSFRLNWAVGGRPAWAPLAASTTARKARKGQSMDILVETGKLRRKAGQLNLWTITREYAIVGSKFTDNVNYGRFHMTGTVNMPERPWAVFQPQDREATERIFIEWLRERAARRGWKN